MVEKAKWLAGIWSACLVLATASCTDLRQADQTGSPPAPLERIAVPLPAWLAGRPSAPPDSIEDLPYDDETARLFSQSIAAMVAGDWSSAHKIAAKFKYEVAAVVDSSGWYAVLQESYGTGLGPVVIISPAPKTDLIVGAPHASFERGTAEQAALIVTALGARAAIVSGAHRCAARRTSSCSGTTQVCSSAGPSAYRTSDVGHNPFTLYHVAHDVLVRSWPAAVVISLHGMRKRDEIVAIVSDGSRQKRDADLLLSGRLRDEFRSRIHDRSALAVSCNDKRDDHLRYQPLCGSTNVQGRLVNSSSDICHKSAEVPTGRFLHLEQTWDILGQFERGWDRWGDYPHADAVLLAIRAIAPCIRDACRTE